MKPGRVVALAFLAVVLVAAYGFFRDDAAVEAMAREAACAGRGGKCAPRISRLEKTPIWRDLHFRVGSDTVIVRCTRALMIAGEHRCVVR